MYATIGDVRGRGMMIGVEFVKDRATREPAPDVPHALVERAFRKGLLLLGAGKSALRLAPPLVVDDYDVDTALRLIDEALAGQSTHPPVGAKGRRAPPVFRAGHPRAGAGARGVGAGGPPDRGRRGGVG